MDSIFRDLKLNNPSNNLKTLGNQQLNPYNECCFGQQWYEKTKLEKIAFFELTHDELPDVVAYSQAKNWLFLVEAVHSSGPISPIRLVELKRLTETCTADIVFVTAFRDRLTFRKFAPDIAWETEVWIADAPDHLIHFNGDKFLGPYKK